MGPQNSSRRIFDSHFCFFLSIEMDFWEENRAAFATFQKRIRASPPKKQDWKERESYVKSVEERELICNKTYITQFRVNLQNFLKSVPDE